MIGSPRLAPQAQLTGSRLARADLIVHRAVSGAMIRQQDTAVSVMAEIGLGESNLRSMIVSTSTTTSALWRPSRGYQLRDGDNAGVGPSTMQSALDEAICGWMAADSGYRGEP